MIRRFFFAFMIFFSISSLAQDKQNDKNDRPPVIAITAFANFTFAQESHDIMAIRDKVVSDLVRNYECVVLSRSNGFALATENALGKMNAISGGSVQDVDNIPAADFAITGFFKVVKHEPTWATLGCTLLITDLTEKSKADFRKADFVPSEDTNFSPDITAKIVEILKLKPKKKLEPVDEQLNETWAILPISHLESLELMSKPADRSLSMSMELSLQESKKVKKIVDHNEIDKVLQELKISSLSGATESLAGSIAGIVGADRVVMGTARRASRKNNNLRIDLLLVDGKKAVVLDSAFAECKKNELDQTASKLILQLTEQRCNATVKKIATKEMRTKEYEVYKEIICNIKNNEWLDTSNLDFAISLAEAAYMIVPDDPIKLFEISKNLHDDLLCVYLKKLQSTQIKKIVNTIDKLLQPESKFSKPQYPLLIRADSHRILGNHEIAMNLVNTHLSKYPDIEREYANCVLGNIYYDLNDYKKAEECLVRCNMDKSDRYLELRDLACRVYNKVGNDKMELKYLKIAYQGDATRTYFMEKDILTTQRIKKNSRQRLRI